MWERMFDDNVRFRESGAIVERVEHLADQSDYDKSEVYRRLLRLGLDDVSQMGHDALNIPEMPGPADV